jgi:tRNA(fMet)-specific endonuclease VapC
MVRYLLDTNVLIECLRRNRSMIEAVMMKGKCHELAISSVTFGELMVGIFKNDTPRRRAAFHKVLAPIRILSFDESAAAEFARVKSDLEKTGGMIGPYDMQIAGHAICTGRRLVTHNSKEFLRIKRLDWEDWELEVKDTA